VPWRAEPANGEAFSPLATAPRQWRRLLANGGRGFANGGRGFANGGRLSPTAAPIRQSRRTAAAEADTIHVWLNREKCR
jgi:hypothetical protein